jgi:hypothetical protein
VHARSADARCGTPTAAATALLATAAFKNRRRSFSRSFMVLSRTLVFYIGLGDRQKRLGPPFRQLDFKGIEVA